MEIGRLCVKIAGRDAGKKCVIVDVLKGNFVMIDGQTRRRKCNILHLEPLQQELKLKKAASHEEVKKAFEQLGIPITEPKSKQKTSKPVRARGKKAAKQPEAAAKKSKKKAEKQPAEAKTAAPKESKEELSGLEAKAAKKK